MNQGPTRKSICKAQGKNWKLVRMGNVERIMARAPWTQLEALNINRREWKPTARLRRIVRHVNKARNRKEDTQINL